MNADIRAAMATGDVQARFATFATDPATSTPEELARMLASEVAKIKRIARSVPDATTQ